MSPESSQDVTRLLLEWSRGNRAALDDLLPLVYDELRQLAKNYLRRERTDHTLNATALVHEAYLRMIDQTKAHFQNRVHFFAVAAQVMRRILIDYARRRTADKRGGGEVRLSLDENIDLSAERAAELVALDDALQILAEFDPQKARIVELKYFGGLTTDEVAAVLGVGRATVTRGWRTAKAWLHKELTADGGAL